MQTYMYTTVEPRLTDTPQQWTSTIYATVLPFTSIIKQLLNSGHLAWHPARRESTWYTLMHFRLIKNGVAHVYDIYTV